MHRKRSAHFVIALLLILGGGFLAHRIQTDGGRIAVRDVRFAGTAGTIMSGLLYIPENATSEQPAPGVLAVHGYINSRETQDGFAIEFARRGFVVLALDQAGHGFSDPPAFANGYGGPDGLRYLKSLEFVDPENIGLEGHSMGGWAVLIAAATYPDDYRSIAIVGSSTGTAGAAEGSSDTPRNLGVIFSRWDEFSGFMWDAPVPANIVSTEKLKTVFGTADPVVPNRLYGSIEDGSARILHMPAVTHPGDHLSTEAIGRTVAWMQSTLSGGNDLSTDNQIWYWKEFGTLLALIGAVWFLFPMSQLLLGTEAFGELVGPEPEPRSAQGLLWWTAALLTASVPVATYYWANHLGNALFPVTAMWPQSITTGIMTWAFGNGLLTALLIIIWHYSSNKKRAARPYHYGLGGNITHIFRSLGLALCLVGSVYLLLAISDWAFKTDFRIWVLAIKLMTPRHFGAFVTYFPPFAVFFAVLSVALHGQLRTGVTANILLLVAGFVLLLLYQYLPLLSGGTMPLGEPLLTIVAFQIIPLLSIAAVISTVLFRNTGSIYPGALVNAVLITWIVVAGQAFQYGN